MPRTYNYDYLKTFEEGSVSYSSTVHHRRSGKCDVELWKDSYGFWLGKFIFEDGSEEDMDDDEAENMAILYKLEDDHGYDQMYEKFQSKVPMRW